MNAINTIALQQLRHIGDMEAGEDELRIVGSLLRRKSIQNQSRRDIYTTKSFSSIAAIKQKKKTLLRKTSDLPEEVDSDEEEQTFVSTLTRENSSLYESKKSINSSARAQCNKIGAIVLLVGVILLISLGSFIVSPIHDVRKQSQSSRILQSQEETLVNLEERHHSKSHKHIKRLQPTHNQVSKR